MVKRVRDARGDKKTRICGNWTSMNISQRRYNERKKNKQNHKIHSNIQCNQVFVLTVVCFFYNTFRSEDIVLFIICLSWTSWYPFVWYTNIEKINCLYFNYVVKRYICDIGTVFYSNNATLVLIVFKHKEIYYW